MKFLSLSIVFILILSACGNETKLTTFQVDSPEFAIKKWQGLVDSSNYEAAKAFSTERTIKWLDKNKAATEAGDSLGYQMLFKTIGCKISGDSAFCSCVYTMNADTTSYFDEYIVKKINGKWCVDLGSDEMEIFE